MVSVSKVARKKLQKKIKKQAKARGEKVEDDSSSSSSSTSSMSEATQARLRKEILCNFSLTHTNHVKIVELAHVTVQCSAVSRSLAFQSQWPSKKCMRTEMVKASH